MGFHAGPLLLAPRAVGRGQQRIRSFTPEIPLLSDLSLYFPLLTLQLHTRIRDYGRIQRELHVRPERRFGQSDREQGRHCDARDLAPPRAGDWRALQVATGDFRSIAALSAPDGHTDIATDIQQGTLALSANYNVTFGGANLTITPRPLTVTADNKTRQFGAANPPLTGVVVGFVARPHHGELLDDGHVDAKLLGKVFDSCPTLIDKVNFLSAVLLQPPTDQQREWIEAFGLAWRWTDIVANAQSVSDVMKAVCEGSTIADRSVN